MSSILPPPQNGCSESKLVAELRSEEFQVKLPELQFERSRDPVPGLKAALSCRSAPETQLIFKAIQWVGLALRPLAVDELLHALNTSTDVSPHGQDLEVPPATVRSREQLMELCFGLLEINDAELVGFANANLRTLVSSPDFPGISPMNGSSGHEMLATVCIRHLQCLDRQTLLKPWISTTHRLLNGRHKCPLRGYATNFWDAHSRMAQSHCTYLTATLHQAILGTISKDDKSDPFHMPTTRGRTNVGLCFDDFESLAKIYLKMGADPNSRTFWPETPLHAAVVNSDFETVLLFLDRGGNPHSPNETRLTSIDLACSSGNEQMAHLLNHRAEDRESSRQGMMKIHRHALRFPRDTIEWLAYLFTQYAFSHLFEGLDDMLSSAVSAIAQTMSRFGRLQPNLLLNTLIVSALATSASALPLDQSLIADGTNMEWPMGTGIPSFDGWPFIFVGLVTILAVFGLGLKIGLPLALGVAMGFVDLVWITIKEDPTTSRYVHWT